jgi:hypothetical protein
LEVDRCRIEATQRVLRVARNIEARINRKREAFAAASERFARERDARLLEHAQRGLKLDAAHQRLAEERADEITSALENAEAFPEELERFLNAVGRRVLLSEDPLAEVQRLLGLSDTPGRKSSPDEGLLVAKAVLEEIAAGKSRSDALAAVAEARNLSFERVQKLYNLHRRVARLDGLAI